MMLNASEYFEAVHNRVSVTFRRKHKSDVTNPVHTKDVAKNTSDPTAPGYEFDIIMSRKSLYDAVCEIVGGKVGAPADRILFSQTGYGKVTIKRNEKMTVGEMVGGQNIGVGAVLVYEVLDMSVSEFELKRSVKFIVMDAAGKEHGPWDLFVLKTADLRDVVQKAGEKSGFQMESIGVNLLKDSLLGRGLGPDENVGVIGDGEVLYLDLYVEEAGTRTAVVHFGRDVTWCHSTPFYICLREGESVAEFRARLRVRAGFGYDGLEN
jgi:ubiquitin carboxyl-terminal hydrolase 7